FPRLQRTNATDAVAIASPGPLAASGISAYRQRRCAAVLHCQRDRYLAVMRYLALCTDYDGTIAHDGRVDAPTIAALEELRASGRKLVLVTGRQIEDLQTVVD